MTHDVYGPRTFGIFKREFFKVHVLNDIFL